MLGPNRMSKPSRARPWALLILSSLSQAACRHATLPPPDYPEHARVERAASKADAPVEVLLFREEFVLDDKGGFTQTTRQRYRILTDEGVTAWGFSGAAWSPWFMDKPSISATVTSPTGEPSSLDPAALTESAAYPDAPQMYRDARSLRGPLPNLKVGAVVDETIVTHTSKPYFGAAYAHYVPVQVEVPRERVEIVVDVPESASFAYELRDAKLEVDDARAKGRRRLTLRGGPFGAVRPTEALAPSDVPEWPELVFTSGTSWRELARAYAGSVDEAIRADKDRLEAVAQTVVAPSDSPAVKADKLLAWIRKRVRYVGVELGEAAVTPHGPDATLRDGYGDCKDQAVLLVALMHAKGIAAEAVLININPLYELSGPAVISFDHCITYLPEWDLYADTTAAGAPFGTVGFAEYGKPLLHVRAGGAPPDRVPPVAPEVAVQALRTVATLEADGAVVGTSANEAHGPYATALRSAGRTIAAQGSAKAAAAQLRSLGEPGEGSFTLPEDEAMGPDYRVEGTFKLEAHPEWLEGEGFRMPTGLRLLARTGDLLIGPVRERKLPATEPTPCHAGRSEETLSLTLPPGYRPARMPKNTTVSGSFFHYESRFGFADGVVTARRSLVSSFDQAFCAGAQREEAARGLAAIRRDLGARLSLERIADP